MLNAVHFGLLVIFLLSCVVIFFNVGAGLGGFAVLIVAAWIATKTGRELNLTMGDLAKKINRENYLKARRDSKT